MAIKTAPTPTGEALGDTRAARAPRLASSVVPRPRLFAVLDEGAVGAVTLVCAPAGKTILLVPAAHHAAGSPWSHRPIRRRIRRQRSIRRKPPSRATGAPLRAARGGNGHRVRRRDAPAGTALRTVSC